MTDDLKAKLASEVGPVFWSDLRAHAARDALFLVAPELDMSDVAYAIATDQGAMVQAWVESGQLVRPTPEQLESWNTNPEKPFRSVVVQPFALAQASPDAPTGSR